MQPTQLKDFQVLAKGDEVFSVTLNQTNIGQNNNKFYIIQVFVHDTKPIYHLWSHWGRGLQLPRSFSSSF